MSETSDLTVIVRPCNSGMCPTLYSDDTGKVFIQGLKLSSARKENLSVSDEEEIVEVSPELLSYLKAF